MAFGGRPRSSRAMHVARGLLLVAAAGIPLVSAAGAPAEAHCFVTNDVRVCHDPRDQSLFYRTPDREVAYNVQVIHDGDRYAVVYHAEPQGPLRSGDSIKAGATPGAYTFHLPDHAGRFGGLASDPGSLLTSDGIGGGGNPMTVAGRPGDPFFYIFFLGVSDDKGTRNQSEDGWRHYLLEARTQDFASFELKTAEGWTPAAPDVRPATLRDAAGSVIRSNTTRNTAETQGLIGSIAFVGGLYHFFYLDYAPDRTTVNLYHRTTADVGAGPWSAPDVVLSVTGFAMIRVAKGKDVDRWAVLYGCYAHGVQDICLQYTRTLDVQGADGIAGLSLTPAYAFGFSADGKPRSFTQPFWLTDRWGNLDTVGSDTGGEMYWTDMDPAGCPIRPRPYCPVAGGLVYRAGWTATLR